MEKSVVRKYYKYKMNIGIINVISLILFILPIIPIFKKINNFVSNSSIKTLGIVLIAYFFWMLLHEALHGLAHLLCGTKLKDISFGAALEKGVLFCLIRKEVSKKQILISLIFPFFFIGVVTYIIGLIIDSPILLILSIFNIGGASGDLLMFYHFMKLDKDITYIEPGDGTSFYLTSCNLKNKKMFGLDFVEEGEYKEDMFNEKTKTIDISKTSWIYFVVCIALSIICIFL